MEKYIEVAQEKQIKVRKTFDFLTVTKDCYCALEQKDSCFKGQLEKKIQKSKFNFF